MTLSICPPIRQQFKGNDGLPLAGASLYVLTDNTSSNDASYTDDQQEIENANPIVLDSSGRTPNGVFLADGSNIRFRLNDITEGGIKPVASSTDDLTSEWKLAGDPTYIGATSFSLVGDVTATLSISRRLKCTVTAGTVYGKVVSSTYSGGVTTVVTDATLDSGLSVVEYGLFSYVHSSIPAQTKGYFLATYKEANTGDGTGTIAGNWLLRATTNIIYNTVGWVSATGFPAGTYLVNAWAVVQQSGLCQVSVQNPSSTYYLHGSSNNANTTDGNLVLVASGEVTLVSDTRLFIYVRGASTGTCTAASSTTGSDEVYTILEFIEI